ncbi:MAG: alpha-L-fucosidase, partial [Clostridiales bacterium]|nr:alpha-L-fucosidase [Clostridiales bacterium]
MATGKKFLPSFESLREYECPDWFRDAKFGIWSHWGPQSVPMAGDWYARQMYIQGSPQYNYHVRRYGHPSKLGYKDICASWKAENVHRQELMSLYKKAGARYIVA